MTSRGTTIFALVGGIFGRSLRSIGVAVALGGITVPAVAADGDGPARIEMSDDGPIFVTPAGMSLYIMGADAATPGKSVCSAKPALDFPDPTAGFGRMKIVGHQFVRACTAINPPFLAPADAKPSGDWSLFDRPEGGRQWVFDGKPLYTSVRDAKPGDRNGIAMDQLARRGAQLAAAPYALPPGLMLLREGDDLVLAADNKALFTPRGARLQQACVQCDPMQPVAAPDIVRVAKPWSVSQPAVGQRQYAYDGKPLFSSALTDEEVLATGDWEMVVLRHGAGRPDAIGTYYSPVIGDYYTTKTGQTLYVFTCTSPHETAGSPGCDLPGGPAGHWAAMCGTGEECARRWRPYLAPVDAKPVGEWSVVETSVPMFFDPAGRTFPEGAERVRAWAYRGRPVLTFHEDVKPGDIWGNMTRWFAFTMFVTLPVPGRSVNP